MTLAGYQINPIDVNFHLQKSLEIFDKKISWQNPIQKVLADKKAHGRVR